jgi:hypothetical protein
MNTLKPFEIPATQPRRNPMLADTEPTDEELHLVMCEARDVALQRKQVSEIWMREQMENALREAKARMRAHGR